MQGDERRYRREQFEYQSVGLTRLVAITCISTRRGLEDPDGLGNIPCADLRLVDESRRVTFQR